MLRLELPGGKQRGRTKRKKRDVGGRVKDAEDRIKCRKMIRCVDP